MLHNFETVKCCIRQFEDIEKNLKNQIKGLGKDYDYLSDNVDKFFEFSEVNQRNDLERKFRVRGKNHKSIIGKVNSGVESMNHVIGGELHNEIGLCNNCLDLLFSDLKKEKLEKISDNIKVFLDSPKSAGGGGCTPGQHHGGQYNG